MNVNKYFVKLVDGNGDVVIQTELNISLVEEEEYFDSFGVYLPNYTLSLMKYTYVNNTYKSGVAIKVKTKNEIKVYEE